jgi:hypothetical protein
MAGGSSSTPSSIQPTRAALTVIVNWTAELKKQH